MAKTICKLLGVLFILVGLIGFAKSDLLGAHLTTAHNLVHLISGAVALYFGFAASLSAARAFCLVFGAVYLLLGVVGFIMGTGDDRMLNVIPNQLMLGTADHAIHILLGVIFLVGALMTKDGRARVTD
ncbi:MAG TPA: DUF4383 domain-containing protein [Pyrinomonadaceae bacterium]|nr:DUF4383 domain-containing protein [Pyrinomonadaceae bacterium]